MRIHLVAVAAIATSCGHTAPSPQSPGAQPHATKTPFAPTANLPIASDDLMLPVGNSQLGVTITHPTAPARYPGIVLIAGSGPTDRDWNSKLIATHNGSGKLLGDALAAHGAVVFRFDKAATGKTTVRLSDITLDTFRDEALAGLAALRARPDVDSSRLFIAGHSEGGLHALRAALVPGTQLRGVILLSAPGRSLITVLLGQIEHQLRDAMPSGADAELATLRAAFADFTAGRPVDTQQASKIPALQQLVASFVAPDNAKVLRPMAALEPAQLVAQVAVPVLVVNGEKDIQVDPDLDAGALANARRSTDLDVTVFLAPDADHVLKHEPKTIAELRGNPHATQDGYNAPDRVLDPQLVDAIVAWIAKVAS
jgi:uncharacterized protein